MTFFCLLFRCADEIDLIKRDQYSSCVRFHVITESKCPRIVSGSAIHPALNYVIPVSILVAILLLIISYFYKKRYTQRGFTAINEIDGIMMEENQN